jgi:hypothetical protein
MSETHNYRMFNFLKRKIQSKAHSVVQDFILTEIKQNFDEFETENLLKITKLTDSNVMENFKNESKYKVTYEYIMKHKNIDPHLVNLYLIEAADYSLHFKMLEECVRLNFIFKYRTNPIQR